MNDLFKKLQASLTALWAKWTAVQKIIVFGIIAAAIAAVVFVFSFSARPPGVALFNVPIADQSARDNITFRLDEENIHYTVNPAGIISVDDAATARRARVILMRENLVPTGVDPWNLFDVQRWTVDDMTQNVNLRRSIERQLKQHIEALDDVDRAEVVVPMPEKTLFASQQQPVKASVSIAAKPNSDIYTNRKKIRGIQRLVTFAVDGLTDDNLVITDSAGNVLNNFDETIEFDRLDVVAKQQNIIAKWESDYSKAILAELQHIFSADRVRVVNVKVEMDMSKETSQAKVYSPIVRKKDNPDTPYDDSELIDYLPLESQTITKEWDGRALQPGGPAGTEGQNSPVYSDANNFIGKSTETGVSQRNVINSEEIQKEKSPTPGRVTVSVAIDGTWKKKYDDKGNIMISKEGAIEREYTPVEEAVMRDAETLVQNAIGYNRARDDSVSVRNIPFDRTAQFLMEDRSIMRSLETKRTAYMVLGGVAAVLFAFMAFRFIAKERERRRRLKEEELLRKRQMERDKSLWDAEQGAMEVTMSVEERRRTELQENAIAAAKEHPEDVAQLIRTWLMEE